MFDHVQLRFIDLVHFVVLVVGRQVDNFVVHFLGGFGFDKGIVVIALIFWAVVVS